MWNYLVVSNALCVYRNAVFEQAANKCKRTPLRVFCRPAALWCTSFKSCFCGCVDSNLGQRFSCSLIYYTFRNIIIGRASLIPFVCSTSSSCDSVNEYLRQRSFLMGVICFAMKYASSKMSNRAYIHGPANSRPQRSYLDWLVGYFICDLGSFCVLGNGCPALWISSSRQHRCNTCGGYLPCLLFIHEYVLWGYCHFKLMGKWC